MNGEDLIRILERKSAISILLELKARPGLTKRDIIRTENGGNDRTRFLRIGELIEAGLVEVDQSDRQLHLTKRGQKVAYHLEKMLDNE